MVKFDYTSDGQIVGVRDTFSAFNEPSALIFAQVTALIGITNEMVARSQVRRCGRHGLRRKRSHNGCA